MTQLAFLLSSLGVLAGCGEATVDTEPLKDAQQAVTRAKDSINSARREFESAIARGRELQRTVDNLGAYTTEAKSFVDKSLASTDEKIQRAAEPVMQAAVLKDPVARALIFAQLKQRAREGSKAAGEMLKDLEALVKSQIGKSRQSNEKTPS